MEDIMAGLRVIALAVQVASRQFVSGITLIAAGLLISTVHAQAQQAQCEAYGRVIVIGEGSVSVTPDYALITSGVTTEAKTVKGATDVNSKLMAAITTALLDRGIEQKDIQTSRFSIRPVYAPHEPRTEPKISGYNVSNQVSVTVRKIGDLGEILDHLVTAGVTDVGNIAFLVSDASKAADQAREAAMADARRKAEVYAHASGIQLGRVEWITEDAGVVAPVQTRAQGASAAMAATVPISAGEDTLRVRVTVGFGITR
jgi:uncharacterized protein YggE